MSDPSFHDFYRATLRPLVAHLRRLGLAHDQDLEDVVQEAYAQAFKSWASLRAREAQLVWLLTIARRQWGRLLAKKGRLPLAQGTDEELDALVEASASVRALDEDVARSGLFAKLRSQIELLADPRQKQAIELFYLFDLDLSDVSAATGVNASTLTTWFSRFRQRARLALAMTGAAASGGED